jgi:hypothetical protein
VTTKTNMTRAMRNALESDAKWGDATRHLTTQSDWGGWSSTRYGMIKRGWFDPRAGKVTDAGRAAYAAITSGERADG